MIDGEQLSETGEQPVESKWREFSASHLFAYLNDVAPLPLIRGVVALAPHENGRQAIVRPGVVSPAPIDPEHPTAEGWRRIIWSLLPNHVMNGYEKPTMVTVMSLDEIVHFARSEPPELLQFISGQLTKMGGILSSQTRPDSRGQLAPSYKSAKALLDDLQLDCTRALGEAWVKENLVFTLNSQD